jgi:hypothetical protein
MAAFMRGLTFPGGQQPVIKGEGVYLRYPRVSDFVAWAKLRADSRAFLSPWEPLWSIDELSKGAFRRRLRGDIKKKRGKIRPMHFWCFARWTMRWWAAVRCPTSGAASRNVARSATGSVKVSRGKAICTTPSVP